MTQKRADQGGPARELSVVAPCLNEEPNLPELVSRVLGTFDRGGFEGELILVDDGSTDGTRALIEKLGRESNGRVVGVFHQRNQGIAQAWKSGLAVAKGRLVATIDADLQYQPEDLLRLRRTLYEHSIDLVQGYRSPVGRRRDDRYTLSRGFNTLLNGVFSMRLQDNKSGFVMAAKEVLEDVLSDTGGYYYFQSFIMVAAHAKGYSYREVETLFEERRQGVSFLSGTNAWKASARSFVDLGRAAWRFRVDKTFKPKAAIALPKENKSLFDEAHWRAYMLTFDRTHWTITRGVERQYEELKATERLDPQSLGDLGDEKLRRLVRHAYRNVPFYRARMQERGLRPEDIRTREDLVKLPLLSKADIRQNLYFDILSEDHDKDQMLRITTSGSSGEPFVCFVDRAQLEFRWAATLRAQEWTGYRFGDRAVRLWHQTIGLSREQAIKERADAFLSRRTFIPVFELSDATLKRVIDQIAEARPTLLDGYAEALDLLSRYAVSNGLGGAKVGAIMSSAQTLPDLSRQVIEKAFDTRVFDKYGSREFSGIAYECEAHQGHHVVAEGYLVEILKDGEPARPGELGEVVITDLNNYCMPFLRYRIGDLAVAMHPGEKCACGRSAPRIGRIEGRVQSIIVGENGRYLPGTFFAHYLRQFEHAIQQFQVIQERPMALRFRVVKSGRYSEDVLREVLATFRHYLGPGMEIEVEKVNSLPLVRTGKSVPAVSSLGIDFQREKLTVATGTESMSLGKQ